MTPPLVQARKCPSCYSAEVGQVVVGRWPAWECEECATCWPREEEPEVEDGPIPVLLTHLEVEMIASALESLSAIAREPNLGLSEQQLAHADSLEELGARMRGLVG